MPKFTDISGKSFGRWSVLERAENHAVKTRAAQWMCLCECGTRRVVVGDRLIRGVSKSCGCLHREIASRKKPISWIRNGNCLDCTSHFKHNGYPRIGRHRRSFSLVKLVCERRHGPLPEGFVPRHTCDNPSCIRPDHIIPGTQAQNMDDMVLRGRSLVGEKHHMAKLSDSDILEVRSSKLPGVFFAKKMGVSKGHISSIRKRKTWKHL